MDLQIYGFLFTILLSFTTINGATLQQTKTPQINSNSVLVALLDSHYTELSELIEKALLLQTLEQAVTTHNITIFAPNNQALELDIDPEFKQFLLEPRNLKSLQNLLLFHMIPSRIHLKNREDSRMLHTTTTTLCNDEKLSMHFAKNVVINPDHIIKPDGIIHGIQRVLIPKSVQQTFNNRRDLKSISAVIPQGAPEIDPRTKKNQNPNHKNPKSPNFPGALPELSIYSAMAPGPSLAPAPAPGPGGPHHHFDGESQVKDFIQTLLHYGGYNELADILVNLTSLATEMGRLVSEGYVITVLAPNDEAMAKLTTDQLSEPGAPEQIMYYHIIPEYQTEESMYNTVKRFGKIEYDTLRLPYKIVAQEGDGSVKFGFGDDSSKAAYLFDPDIYTDGRISVQGIDGVLFPVEDLKVDTKDVPVVAKVAAKPRRGKLMEVACNMFGSFCH